MNIGKTQYNTFSSELLKKIGIVPIVYSPVKYTKTSRIVNDYVDTQIPDLKLIFRFTL